MPPRFCLYCTTKWMCQRYWTNTGALYNNILWGFFFNRLGALVRGKYLYWHPWVGLLCHLRLLWCKKKIKIKNRREKPCYGDVKFKDITFSFFLRVDTQTLTQTIMARRHAHTNLITHQHARVPLTPPSAHTSYKHGSTVWRLSSIKRYCLSSLESPNPLVSAVYSPGSCPALPL